MPILQTEHQVIKILFVTSAGSAQQHASGFTLQRNSVEVYFLSGSAHHMGWTWLSSIPGN